MIQAVQAIFYFFYLNDNGVDMDFTLARFNMVEGQIKTNRVTDPYVIEAMGDIPREKFVPAARQGVAYIDDAIDLGASRALLEPMVIARMLETAEISADDIVLDVACANGYSTAVLSKIAGTVVGLESNSEFAKSASDALDSLGIDNAVIIEAPLADGYAQQAPYDVILVNGAVPTVPDALKNQLKEGGRLVVAEQNTSILAKVSVYTKQGDIVSKRDILEAGVHSLHDFKVEKGFVF